MAFLSLPYIGSFQQGYRVHAEHPLEEVWSRVSKLGITEFVRRGFVTAAPASWDWQLYAATRIRQAVEFRRASQGASVLTRPLTQYYSVLNLTRAMHAIRIEVRPTPSHGLKFTRADALLDCAATPTKDGTFPEYLAAHGLPKVTGTFTLRECLAHIPESGDAFMALNEGHPRCVSLDVHALRDQQVRLEFYCPWDAAGFRTDWATWFPELAGACTLEPEGTFLRVAPGDATKSYESIGAFLESKFWCSLVWSDSRALWYARRAGSLTPLPRPAYYFLSLYILGNVVRYTPEQLAPLTNPDSPAGWTVERFLQAAERFYPQLMLHWVEMAKVFF
jgi:hypothetical protein